MKLSVIIPAYNVERYLERCVISCESQDLSHDDYEIIIVDDGSTDGTLNIANKLQSRYSNIIVITQQNQGQSVARNIGIEYSNGDYIWFVDSDDYIDSNTMKFLINRAYEFDLDVLLFYLKIDKENDDFKREVIVQKIPMNTAFKQGDVLYNGYLAGTACGSLIKSELIRKFNLRFVPDLFHQDSEFMIRLLSLAQNVMHIEDAPYNYYIREGSTLTSKERLKVVKRIVDDAIISRLVYDFANEQRDVNIDERLYSFLLHLSRSIHFGTLMNLWNNRRLWRKNGMNRAILNQLKDIDLYPLKSPYNNWKQKMFSVLILNNEKILC